MSASPGWLRIVTKSQSHIVSKTLKVRQIFPGTWHLPHKRLPRNILRTNLNIFIPDYLFAVQKISPEGKPKVQLQVVLHDNNNTTFHFVNRNGMEAQIQDRDKVKELLQQLLPNFKRKVDKELEEKNRYGYLISC